MEIAQLDTTNVVLWIIAGLAVVQLIALVVAAMWLSRTLKRVSQAAAGFESERLAPLVDEVLQLANRAQQVMAELQSTVHRANALVHGIEDRTHRAMATVDSVNERVDAAVSSGLTRVRAFETGLRRGMSALVGAAEGDGRK